MERAIRYMIIGIGALAGGSLTAFVLNKASNTGEKMGSGGNVKAGSKLLFIGDSYTAGSNSYADQIKKNNPDVEIKKIAKVGEKTDWMLKNASADISSKKYDTVYILGGLNDVYAKGNIDSTKQNLQAMYDMVKKSGANVVGITIAPTDYYSAYTPVKGRLTDDLNEWIKNNNTLDTVIDFNKMLKSGGKQNLDLFVSDKLHASTKAHQILANHIK